MLDFIGVMAFNYYQNLGGPYSHVYHHAPLFHEPGKFLINTLNADYVVNELISEGASPSKIVLGIPIFGTTWAVSSNDTKLMASAVGKGAMGELLGSQVEMSYCEICRAVRYDGWQVFQDPDKKLGPYAISPASNNERTWVGYDDPEMAVVKANYILSKGLGGAYVWDVSQDDFRNFCGQGSNPMLTTLANSLGTRASN